MKELKERPLPRMSSFSFIKKHSEFNKKNTKYYVIWSKQSQPFLLGSQTTMVMIGMTTIISISHMFMVVEEESI